jgi:hypothetical protein
MSSLENKINILKIDYSDKSIIKEYTKEKYKDKFNWKYYAKYYKDLKLNTLNDAWKHWIKIGINEKKKFFLNNNKPIKQNKQEDNSTTFKEINVNKITAEKNDKTIQFKNTIKQNINDYKNSHIYKISNDLPVNANLLYNYNNIILKKKYDNYGVHYYGWKNAIHKLTNQIISEQKDYNVAITEHINSKQHLLDEWLEKLLIWGDKNQNKYIINEIVKNNYGLITFLHNPPFSKWYDNQYKNNVENYIIYNDTYTNKKIFQKINQYKLHNKITFLYTLSISHKEYIYNKVPNYCNKLMSVLHPINITGDEQVFDYNLFTQNRQIIHIGWQLRNFKKFIDLILPKDFFKTILIKSEFEQEWNTISNELRIDTLHQEYITVLHEVTNSDYEKIFTNSCIFLYLEDCVANNTILECIKFNTPIIINKLPSIVEYLGEDYPLYYESDSDLENMKNYNYLIPNIKKANEYLQNMDKAHISEKTFYNKITYDLDKLSNTENKLTWFCYVDNVDNIVQKLHNLYNVFSSQVNSSENFLQIIISDKLETDYNSINTEIDDKSIYKHFIEKLDMFQELVNNISYKIIKIDNYSQYLNKCFEMSKSPFITFVDLNQYFDPYYSRMHINYILNNPFCDIVFSSYKFQHSVFSEKFVFNKDLSIFSSNYSNVILPCHGVVFRKNMIKILSFNETVHFENIPLIFREFFLRSIKNHLNMVCCYNKPLFINKF